MGLAVKGCEGIQVHFFFTLKEKMLYKKLFGEKARIRILDVRYSPSRRKFLEQKYIIRIYCSETGHSYCCKNDMPKVEVCETRSFEFEYEFFQ